MFMSPSNSMIPSSPSKCSYSSSSLDSILFGILYQTMNTFVRDALKLYTKPIKHNKSFLAP
jgi:hypothetical protein